MIMLQVASVVRSSVPPEQTLCSWLWEVAFKIQLHAYQQPQPGAASPTSGFTQVTRTLFNCFVIFKKNQPFYISLIL